MASFNIAFPGNKKEKEVLRQECWKAITQALREVPVMKHTAFITLTLTEIIEEGDQGALFQLLQAIKRSAEKAGSL